MMKAASVCQKIAKIQMDLSSADYGHAIFYPRLAIEARLCQGKPIDEINRNYAMQDPLGLISRCASQGNFILTRRSSLRRDYRMIFPKKIWIRLYLAIG